MTAAESHPSHEAHHDTIPAANKRSVGWPRHNVGAAKANLMLPTSVENRIIRIMARDELSAERKDAIVSDLIAQYATEKSPWKEAGSVLIVGSAYASVVLITVLGLSYVSKLFAPPIAALPMGEGHEFPDA